MSIFRYASTIIVKAPTARSAFLGCHRRNSDVDISAGPTGCIAAFEPAQVGTKIGEIRLSSAKWRLHGFVPILSSARNFHFSASCNCMKPRSVKALQNEVEHYKQLVDILNDTIRFQKETIEYYRRYAEFDGRTIKYYRESNRRDIEFYRQVIDFYRRMSGLDPGYQLQASSLDSDHSGNDIADQEKSNTASSMQEKTRTELDKESDRRSG